MRASTCLLAVMTLPLLPTLPLSAEAGSLPEVLGGIGSPGLPGNSIQPEGGATTFTDEAAFLASAACDTMLTISFEDQAATNATTLSNLLIPFPTVGLSTNNPPQMGVWDMPSVGAFATDGSNWLGIDESAFLTPMTTTFIFKEGKDHIGINFTDYGDFGGGNLTFTNDIGDVATAAVSGLPDGNSQFFGLINLDNGFTSVTFSHDIGGEFYGIDEIYTCFSLPQADLVLTKTADVASASPGDTVVFTLAASNIGTWLATFVQISDTFPTGLTYVSDDCGGTGNGTSFTWDIISLSTIDQLSCNITASVDPDASGSLVNTASITAIENDPDPTNNSAQATIVVGAVLDIPTLGQTGLLLMFLTLLTLGTIRLRQGTAEKN